jgi:hypothetical protein
MLYLTLAINVLSMAALIAGILMHSGRGGGLSEPHHIRVCPHLGVHARGPRFPVGHGVAEKANR